MIPVTQNIEYKQSWRDEYLKWICGFANADGGSILVGVKDDGSVAGIRDFMNLLEDIPNKARNIMGIAVKVSLLENSEKKYLKIDIPPYIVPVSLRGRYYQRSGSTNQELTGNTLNEFLMRRFGKSWDSVTEDSFSISEIDTETIERFKRLAVDRLPLIIEEKDPFLILNKLNLIQDGKFKRAAILLFGKNPQALFLQSHIKIGRFLSDTDIFSSDIIEGNLFNQVEQAMSILKSKYLISPITFEGIHRREKLELPVIALREALLNAIIHRNYLTTSAIQVRIYDNKVIILNDGALPENLTIEDLKREHLSKPRNTLIADVFYKAGFIENRGRGTLKIISECNNYEIPEPVFESSDHLFSLTFLKTDQKTDQKILSVENLILQLIRSDRHISLRELAASINKGITVTKGYVQKLKKAEKIKRIGPAKGGHWQIIEK